ncbi:MAG: response regulator [Polyangiales bacterium]
MAPAVLVVDDDSELRDEVGLFLEAEGFEVLLAGDGREALDVLRVRPDVSAIVLDLMMPVMDGAEFRREQLQDRSIAGIPFVLLTGRVDFTHMARALGAVACLQKPFEPQSLLRALRPRSAH